CTIFTFGRKATWFRQKAPLAKNGAQTAPLRRRAHQSRACVTALRGKFSRRWLIPIAAVHVGCACVHQLLSKCSCLLSLRSARSQVFAARLQAGSVVCLERTSACRVAWAYNQSHFGRIFCHNSSSTSAHMLECRMNRTAIACLPARGRWA